MVSAIVPAARAVRGKPGDFVDNTIRESAMRTAKQIATVQELSGGRMIFGIGYGWNREEMAQHGTRYGDRREILRDRILAMKASRAGGTRSGGRATTPAAIPTGRGQAHHARRGRLDARRGVDATGTA